jgi:hypothetical protein
MARRPEARYASILDMKRDLEAPDTVTPTGRDKALVTPSLWKVRWRRIQPFVWGILIFLALMGICIAISRQKK